MTQTRQHFRRSIWGAAPQPPKTDGRRVGRRIRPLAGPFFAPLGAIIQVGHVGWAQRNLACAFKRASHTVPTAAFHESDGQGQLGATLPTEATDELMILMTDGLDDRLSRLGHSASTGDGGLHDALGCPMRPVMGDAPGTSADARPPSNPNHRTPVIQKGFSDVTNPSANSGGRVTDGLFTEACTSAKTSPSEGDPPNVSVHTIALSISGDEIDTAGRTLLRSPASSTDRNALADDPDGLIAALSRIAKGLGSPRTSR